MFVSFGIYQISLSYASQLLPDVEPVIGTPFGVLPGLPIDP
jgi:hypothetical protein